MTSFALCAACGALVLASPMLQPSALARPDPRDPAAAVPPVVHSAAVVPLAQPAASGATTWRDANDQVARIGGWRAYAREAQSAASRPATAVHKH